MSRREKAKKRMLGSVSVLMVIILLPMMTFSAIIVDLARINMAKQMMSSAGDLAMNTALANYDTILKDVYGLFAMSQVENMDNEALGTELNEYFAKTLCAYGVVGEKEADEYVQALIGDFREILNGVDENTTNFITLNDINLTATKVPNSSLDNAGVLRKQLVEYMKYRAPIGLGLSFLDSLDAFKKVDDQSAVVEAQVTAQQSTQTVTDECKKLITMIRDYDKLVEELNKSVSGLKDSKDGVVIPLEDYDTHVLKYLSEWGENYTHLNKLNMVFLANSPSVDSVYLKNFDYGNAERYIKTDGTGPIYAKSGLEGTENGLTMKQTSAEAKQQVNDQINNLNNNYKKYTTDATLKYVRLLDNALLTHNSNNYNTATISKANEDAVIEDFINFEKFLLNKSEGGKITYAQVQEVLKQLYILGKYRDNYEYQMTKNPGGDITKQQAVVDAVTQEANGYKSTMNSAKNTMSARVTKINERTKSYLGEYEKMDEVLEFAKDVLSTDKYSQLTGILSKLPAYSGSPTSYFNTNLAGTDQDKYLTFYKWLATNSAFATSGSQTQKNICKYSLEFLNVNNYSNTDYESYIKGKVSGAESEELLKLFSCLKTCHAYAITYKENIPIYNDANSKYNEAYGRQVAEEEILKGLKLELEQLKLNCKNVLAGYYNFCTDYQADAYYYNYYIVAAKNTLNPEVAAIQAQYSQILTNLENLRDALNAIEGQIVTVKGAIDDYTTKLGNWQSKNTAYETANGGSSDSFSEQTQEDIEKAKNEYNKDIYETLHTFLIAVWNEYDEICKKLTEEGNFTYGSKLIKDIKTADDLAAAVSGIKSTLNPIVTVADATAKLSELYKGESTDYVPYTMDYVDPPQLGFLAPSVLQIQALKYLNSTFPDEEILTDDQKTANEETKTEYESAKDKLTGKSSSDGKNVSETPDEPASDFGYIYEGKTLPESGLPSQKVDTKTKTQSDDKYKLNEDDEGNLDAASGVSGQTGKTTSILEGIGNVATTAVENLYLLNYIFENFSYNTIVQEQILKDNPLKSGTVILQIKEAKDLFGDATVLEASKDRIRTLSNYLINEHNNAFYGAEVEYILFGNADAKTNVTSAKASIYALRFVFNCVFAFTDSEIRNTTMTAGLAVQAATLGIVPYQIVQIVLQLALAAAESAIDLSAMSYGLSVAVIKTRDTWSMSISGAKDVLKDAANAAAQTVTNQVVGLATEGIAAVTNGLNGVLDAATDQVLDSVDGMLESMSSAAEGVLESVVDTAISGIMKEVESGLNSLVTTVYGPDASAGDGKIMDDLPSTEEMSAMIGKVFDNASQKVSGIVSNACGGNKMAEGIAENLVKLMNKMLEDTKKRALNMYEDAMKKAEDAEPVAIVSSLLNGMKTALMEEANKVIAGIRKDLSDVAYEVAEGANAELQGMISEYGDKLTEETAAKVKETVSEFTNNFVENTLQVSGSSTGNGGSTEVKSSVVSMFSFGYKDYLMLLTYIAICCGDSPLLRTADMIQMNMQFSTGAEADFLHAANAEGKQFLLSNAYTYVSVSASADLEMFFMDLDLFKNVVTEPATDENGEVISDEGVTNEWDKIQYKGILGY